MWIDLFKDVVAILKKGPKKRWEVIEEVKKGHKESYKTVDRILKALKDAKLIKESEDGRYEWIKEYREFKGIKEYEIKLKHSESLVRSAIKKGDELDNKLHDIGSFLHSDNFHYFLEHLESGYPDTHKLWKKWKKLKSKEEEVLAAYNKEIEKIAAEKGFEIKNFSDLNENEKQVSSEIFESIKRYLRFVVEGKLNERVKLRLGDEGVFDPILRERIATNENIKEDLEELIETCILSETVKNYRTALEEIKKQTSDCGLTDKIDFIIVQIVDDGEPLKGWCARCKDHHRIISIP